MRSRPTLVVLCPTDRDIEYLDDAWIRDRCAVEIVGSLDEVLTREFDEGLFFEQCRQRLTARGDVAGVLGTDDFPAAFIAALLAAHLRLPGPSVAAALACQHKGLSRAAQRAAVPEGVPRFALVDLAHADAGSRPPLPFPFFMKPVKSFASVLARRIDDAPAFAAAVELARAELPMLARGFDALCAKAGVAGATSQALIAEELLGGEQVTVDGYTCDRAVTILGIVDSHFIPGTRSFERFEAPSALPLPVQQRMADIVTRCMRAIALDRVVFNVELMWNPRADSIQIIEINGRMASQFVPIYRALYGIDLYRIQVELALGGTPRVNPAFGAGASANGVAASFVLRSRTDGRVRYVPTPAEIAALRERFPGSRVELLVAQGDRLSDYFQDGETFRYAIVDLAAATRVELHARWAQARAMLPFGIAKEVDRGTGGGSVRPEGQAE